MKPSHFIDFNPQQKQWLEALLSRLRTCRPGETYPLDPVERELILIEIGRLRQQASVHGQFTLPGD